MKIIDKLLIKFSEKKTKKSENKLEKNIEKLNYGKQLSYGDTFLDNYLVTANSPEIIKKKYDQNLDICSGSISVADFNKPYNYFNSNPKTDYDGLLRYWDEMQKLNFVQIPISWKDVDIIKRKITELTCEIDRLKQNLKIVMSNPEALNSSIEKDNSIYPDIDDGNIKHFQD